MELKFDGEFIISYLFNHGYEHIKDRKEKRDKTFTTLISDMGLFYSIEIYYEVKGRKVKKISMDFNKKFRSYPHVSKEVFSLEYGYTVTLLIRISEFIT